MLKCETQNEINYTILDRVPRPGLHSSDAM